MKIFFTTPFDGKKEYQKQINKIISILESNGVSVISPEKEAMYLNAFTSDKIQEYGNKEKAHYAFIRQGIAGSDAVVIESSYDNFRVGHEATLGLMYDKPVLVLSQNKDYSKYISHEKFFGAKYKNDKDLAKLIPEFIKSVLDVHTNESYQSLEDVVDLQHSSVLSQLRFKALQGDSYFADWSRRSSKESEKVYEEILSKFGSLPIQPSWDVFAKIYNEDTPDSVFYGAVRFADKVFKKYNISKTTNIAETACGTGAVSRILTSMGYRYITAFDKSRAMLAEAYRLCSHLQSIKILESSIESIKLDKLVKGIVWFDFSSNFAQTEQELNNWLRQLVNNIEEGGILIFDVRTKTGWNVDFFKQKVTTYETENFQRIWINLPDYKNNVITFDIYIRVKDKNGQWLSWEREQMTERIWGLEEVKSVVNQLDSVLTDGIYGDDFTLLNNNSLEPGLAYFVLQKKVK